MVGKCVVCCCDVVVWYVWVDGFFWFVCDCWVG